MLNKKEVAKNILIGLGTIGVLSAIAIAPGLAKTLPYLAKVDTKRINQELFRLYKRGLIIVYKNKNGIKSIKLTKTGKEELKKLQITNLTIEKPEKWDGMWRIIIFDIPIYKNSSRNILRRKVKSLGFFKLQNSVFIYPYPCFEVVTFLREYFGVKDEVEYIEANRLESQDKLIEHFFT